MENYKVRKIDGHTWQLEDLFKTYLYLLEGEERAFLIDAGNGFSGIKEVAASLTDKPISVLLTHGHFDHTSCAGLFGECFVCPEDMEVLKNGFVQEERAKQVRRFQDIYQVDLPEEEQAYVIACKEPENIRFLTEGQILDLGGRTLEVIETPGHTGGCVCFLDRKQRYLFSGDMVCNREILVYLEHSGTVEDVKKQDEKLLSYRDAFDQIWPGHHECPLDASIIEDYLYAAEQILTGGATGEIINLDKGYKLLHNYKSIGISYTEDHIRNNK